MHVPKNFENAPAGFWPSYATEAYAKNVREKTTKSSLIITEVLLDADGHVLTQVWYLSRYSSVKLFKSHKNV